MNAALSLGDGPCERASRERPYRETLALRDGREVTLRPAHRSDAPALQGFFGTLSARSRRLRFHGAVNRLPDTVLRAFTTQVRRQHAALVALVDLHDGPTRLVAEARYVANATAPGRAEFALSVADAWQGLGLGQALLRRLAKHATSEGLVALDSGVMAGNEPMLGLLRGLGASFLSQGSEVRATLVLWASGTVSCDPTLRDYQGTSGLASRAQAEPMKR